MKIVEKRKDGSIRVHTDNQEPSRTQQQFKETSDINLIMKKYQKGEAITHLNHRQGVYGDFSEIKNYQKSLQTVIDAERQFLTLPSAVRAKFENNPQQLLDFIKDDNNYEESIKLGLITAQPIAPKNDDKLNNDNKPQ